MAAIGRGSYKLEFRVYTGGAYVWTDYTTRLISFGNITMQAEGAMRNSFKATIGDIIVDNSDSFWTTQSDTLLFAGSDPYGTKIRKRRLRISIDVPDSAGVNTNYILFTGLVDDLVIGMEGRATIKAMSLDRNAQEQKLDTDKINNNTIGGSWGTNKLYASRTLNGDNDNYSYVWFKDRRYTDMLQRVSGALDDSAYEHESIAVPISGGGRFASSLARVTDFSSLGGHTIQGIFWSPTHSALLIYTVAEEVCYIFSYDESTNTLTLRFSESGGGVGIETHSYWYNSNSNKIFFILKWQDTGPVNKWSLFQLNFDWTTSHIHIEPYVGGTGYFQGVVTYSQDRNSGAGTIFIASGSAGMFVLIEEFTCGDISSTWTKLNTGTELYDATLRIMEIYHMAYGTGNRLWFVACDARADVYYEIFKIDIATGFGIANVTRRWGDGEPPSPFSIYVDSDRIFFVVASAYGSAAEGYYVRVQLDSQAADVSTLLYTATDDYHKISPLLRGGDGIYFCEHSQPADTTHKIYPTRMFAILDTDKTAAVPVNKMDSSASYGEPLVDNVQGILTRIELKNTTFLFNIQAAFTYRTGTDWILYGLTVDNSLLFQYAKTLSLFSRIWPMRGLSAWDLRTKMAEKYNAVVFYDYDGTFRLKKRPTAGSAAYTITDYKAKSLDNGLKRIINVVKGKPYQMPFGQPAVVDITPIAIKASTSTCALRSIKLGVGVTANSHWRIKMTSTTAFNLDEETAVGVWTNRSSGTKGTTLLYSAATVNFTIPGDDWSGTAVTGDTFMFWTYITEEDYVPCNDIEKIESQDTTSIAAYQRTEQTFDNKFCVKLQLPDIIENIIAYWKNPHRVLAITVPLDLNYKLAVLVNLTDAYLGITTSDVWAITKVVIPYASPQMELELTEI